MLPRCVSQASIHDECWSHSRCGREKLRPTTSGANAKFFLYCHVAVLQRGFYREQMWWTEWPFLLLFMHLELFGESASAMLYHISNAHGFLCRSTELSCAVSKFSSFRHPKSHPISRIGSSWRIVASRFAHSVPLDWFCSMVSTRIYCSFLFG